MTRAQPPLASWRRLRRCSGSSALALAASIALLGSLSSVAPSAASAQAPTDEAPGDVQPSEAPADEDEIAPSDEQTIEADGGVAESSETDDASEVESTDEEDAADEGAPAPPPPTHYTLERVAIRGNTRTDTGVIRSYVPLRDGEALDVEDPRVESIRWRLLATGWFDEVRLSIERGSERGYVVLVVQVVERNTFTVQGLTLGFAEGILNSSDASTQLNPYFGITLSELNLFGTGVGVDLTALVSAPQQGFRVRSGVASLAGSDWGLHGSLFFNNGREFFGNDDVVVALDACPAMSTMPCTEGHNAVVVYRRYGGSIGTGTDLATTLRFTLDYHLEAV